VAAQAIYVTPGHTEYIYYLTCAAATRRMQADHDEFGDAPPPVSVEHVPPFGPADTTYDNNGHRILQRSGRGPLDRIFSFGEIVWVAIPQKNRQPFMVRGEIIQESLYFYTVRYRDPRPDMNYPEQNFCDRTVRKDDEVNIFKYVKSQSHAVIGPDKKNHNPYKVRRPARH